jgi:hypothetical protein
VTESSASSRLTFAVSHMCKWCDELDDKISHYRGFLVYPFDSVTIERIDALILELEQRKGTLHCESAASGPTRRAMR